MKYMRALIRVCLVVNKVFSANMESIFNQRTLETL